MESEVLRQISAYVAISIPVTVAIANMAKIALDWLNKNHQIRHSTIEQMHKIDNHYLEKTLNPEIPLAIRQQLLRFLATPNTKNNRLGLWAGAELKRVGEVIDETNKAVKIAEEELHKAKSPEEIEKAELILQSAIMNQQSLLLPPIKPSISPQSLRAGFIEDKDILNLDMSGENLQGVALLYRNLKNADFSEANLSESNFQGSDLRGTSFKDSNLTDARIHLADLRGADFRGANMTNTNLGKSRVEGANFQNSIFENVIMTVTYDESTKWPEGFNLERAGAVKVPNDVR
jgi:hypothetical protein